MNWLKIEKIAEGPVEEHGTLVTIFVSATIFIGGVLFAFLTGPEGDVNIIYNSFILSVAFATLSFAGICSLRLTAFVQVRKIELEIDKSNNRIIDARDLFAN